MAPPYFVTCILIVFAFLGRAADASQIDPSLEKAALKAYSTRATTNQVKFAIQGGIWNSNKTALATIVPQPWPRASMMFVFLKATNRDYLAVDVSALEDSALVRLGLSKRPQYQRFETTFLHWRKDREDSLLEISSQTRFWKNGKRFTTGAFVVISRDGKSFWQ
jgi:hypothetical protein